MDIISKTQPLTKRVQQGATQIQEGRFVGRALWGKGLSVIDEESIKLPLVIRKSLAVKKVLSEMPVQIKEYELIVGCRVLGTTESMVALPEYATDDEKKAAAERFTSVRSTFGHMSPHYPSFLKKGLAGLIEEVNTRLNGIRQNGADPEQVAWYESILSGLDGMRELVRRYHRLAIDMASDEKDEIRKNELQDIAQICRNLLERAPQTFHEAVQAMWFVHISLYSTGDRLPLGRIDQTLWPFLKKDLEKGEITLPEAQELVDLLWLKSNETIQTFAVQERGSAVPLESDEESKEVNVNITGGRLTCLGGNSTTEKARFDGGSSQQTLFAVVLSGLTPDGKDGTNPLTYLCLNTVLRLKVPMPYTYIRLHDNSPAELYERIADCIRAGCSGPTIYNDEIIVPALVDLGIPIEDARDYAPVGCFETHVQGKTEFRHIAVSAAEALERTLNPEKWEKSKSEGWYIESMDPWRDWTPPDPNNYTSLEDIMKSFNEAMDRNVKGIIETYEKFRDGRLYKIAPLPVLSSLFEGPLEAGKDITQGGAKYVIYMLEISGLATAADSLAAIKKLCFEEKSVKLSEILDAMRNNWEGKEYLRRMVKNKMPAYGNDDDYVDDIATEIARMFLDSLKKHRANSKSGTIYTAGIATFEGYTALGTVIGATPDGRLTGEALSDNASPTLGRAVNGQTAALNSFLKLPNTELSGGSCLCLAMSPVSGALSELPAFLRSFIERKGNIINISVNDCEKLRAAQKEPDKYRDLIVRVGGYEAYFVDLPPKHQELQILKSSQYS